MSTLKPSKSGIMSNIFVRFCGPLLTMFPPPPKKIYIWGGGGYGPLTPPLHRRLWLEIGGGILWNLLPTKINPRQKLFLEENWPICKQTVDYRFCRLYLKYLQYLLLSQYGFHIKNLCNL